MSNFVKTFINFLLYTRFGLSNWLLMKTGNISYESFPKIFGIVVWKCKGKLFIGKNVKITSSFYGNAVGGQSKTCFLVTKTGSLSIGNNTAISNATIVSMKSIVIEEDVMIGGGAQIFDTDFHSIFFNTRMKSPDPDIKTSPVIIKKGAFIGMRAVVLKGVTIGEYSVVAAGSIVTQDIPPSQVWGGNPAKFIKSINNL